ncbi:hypothetical protein EDD99_4041 [Streptomyces sp. 846.5]|nr:hypothetical protein [Streptomyces sp. 846.5]TDU05525.1 hypothetical protein EDD99_4041 [Streptomyces sp. 846.5]
MRRDVLRFAELAGLSTEPSGRSLPWERSREECGVDFPADYREFVDLFGAGEVRGYLGVSAPWPFHTTAHGETGFRGFVAATTDDIGPAFRQMRAHDPNACPHPFWPEPGGLLLWGATYQGDHFFWLTSDPDPMEWPVVAWFRGSLEWRRYNMRFVAFLLHALSGDDREMRELLDWPDAPVWAPPS